MADPAGTQVVEPDRPSSFDSFINLEFGRQLGLMIGLAASVAIGVGVAMHLVVQKDFKPIYANLDRMDASSIVDVLDANFIEYRIDERSGALLVDANKLQQARLKLSAAGMPSDQNRGFELLDQDQPLGTSQFMENARYRRGLEGEIARTISNIGSVRAARVHLAIPKSTVFLRDKREPKASVFIESYQGLALDNEQVRGIANLVVSSVPELKLRNVTIVDQRGNMLSDFNSNPKYAEASRQLDYTRQVELDILQRVNSLLEPILGMERFRAEVSADLDFTELEQTAETYNPDVPAIRSEQTTSEQTIANGGATGVPGALSNQPPGTGQTEGQIDPATGEPVPPPAQSRVLETRNFELDRTISHTRHQIGRVRRLTVAVALDDMPAPAPVAEANAEDAAVVSGKVPWQQEELDRFSLLVQNAVGFNASRGDRVTVINTPFMRPEYEPLPEVTVEIWEQPLFWTALRITLGVLGFLIVIFFVLRPALKRLIENSRKIKDLEAKHLEALNAVSQITEGSADAVIGDDGRVTLTSPSKNLLPSPQDDLDDQIGLVKNMIDDDPDRVAQVIQGWTASE